MKWVHRLENGALLLKNGTQVFENDTRIYYNGTIRYPDGRLVHQTELSKCRELCLFSSKYMIDLYILMEFYRRLL